MKYSAVLLLATTIASAQQNILNGNFEDTTIVHFTGEADTNARHWTMTDFGASITDDVYSGSSAVYIWNWYYYAHGELTNGDALFPKSGGAPIDYMPSSLTGFYKYIAGYVDTENDSAVAIVCLTRYNNLTARRDTIGFGKKKFPFSTGYTAFNVDIHYTGISPDTVTVKFISSENGFCAAAGAGNCLFLYLDQLELSDIETGVRSEVKFENTLRLFPNPASDFLHINTAFNGALTITIFNSLGEVVLESPVASENPLIDIRALPGGAYFVRTDKNTTGSFVKE